MFVTFFLIMEDQGARSSNSQMNKGTREDDWMVWNFLTNKHRRYWKSFLIILPDDVSFFPRFDVSRRMHTKRSLVDVENGRKWDLSSLSPLLFTTKQDVSVKRLHQWTDVAAWKGGKGLRGRHGLMHALKIYPFPSSLRSTKAKRIDPLH